MSSLRIFAKSANFFQNLILFIQSFVVYKSFHSVKNNNTERQINLPSSCLMILCDPMFSPKKLLIPGVLGRGFFCAFSFRSYSGKIKQESYRSCAGGVFLQMMSF